MNQPVRLFQFIILGLAMSVAHSSLAQTSSKLEEDFDLLTSEWLNVSGELKTYSGLNRFCINADFRQETMDILGLLHHYDSLVLQILLDPSYDLDISHREYKHTIKDIQKFEEEFSIKKFIDHLRESCAARNELERSKDDLVKGSNVHSYDGQILVLETDIRRFLNHIDKKVIAIDDHLHMIHVDQVKSFNPPSQEE